MAEIVLGMATTHAPSLNGDIERSIAEGGSRRDMENPMGGGMRMDLDIEAMIRERASWIDKELEPDVRRRRHATCQEAIASLGEVLASVAPDVAIIIGDDTHEVFMPEDHIPSVDVLWMDEIPHRPHTSRVREGGELSMLPGKAELGLHLVESLIGEGFDISVTRTIPEGRSIGHAFDFIYGRIMNGNIPPTVPILVNTYYPPNAPTMRHCYAIGKALRRAIESWESDLRVAVIGSGGLSHLVLDEQLDRRVLEALQDKDEERLATQFPESELTYGTSEIRNWTVAAGAMHDGPTKMTLVAYEPMYRSPAGTGCGCGFAYWK